MVISQRFPYVEIRFKVRDLEKQVFAYIDTGFDGFLIVPAELSKSFGKADLVSVWELGDSSLAEGLDYLGEVQVVGIADIIPAQITCLGNEFMIGLGILKHFKVVLDHGNSVEVTK